MNPAHRTFVNSAKGALLAILQSASLLIVLSWGPLIASLLLTAGCIQAHKATAAILFPVLRQQANHVGTLPWLFYADKNALQSSQSTLEAPNLALLSTISKAQWLCVPLASIVIVVVLLSIISSRIINRRYGLHGDARSTTRDDCHLLPLVARTCFRHGAGFLIAAIIILPMTARFIVHTVRVIVPSIQYQTIAWMDAPLSISVLSHWILPLILTVTAIPLIMTAALEQARKRQVVHGIRCKCGYPESATVCPECGTRVTAGIKVEEELLLANKRWYRRSRIAAWSAVIAVAIALLYEMSGGIILMSRIASALGADQKVGDETCMRFVGSGEPVIVVAGSECAVAVFYNVVPDGFVAYVASIEAAADIEVVEWQQGMPVKPVNIAKTPLSVWANGGYDPRQPIEYLLITSCNEPAPQLKRLGEVQVSSSILSSVERLRAFVRSNPMSGRVDKYHAK